MPIHFNAAEQTWELKDATPEEEASLKQIALDVITDFFGDMVAQRMMQKYDKEQKMNLANIEPENMGTA